MLTGADVIAAKLTVQLQHVDAETVRLHMRRVDQDPRTSIDVLTLLARGGHLPQAAYKEVRRYTAMFEYVRHQAVCLRQLERMGKAKDTVYDLLAQLEYSRYKTRLSTLLVEMGELLVADARHLELAANQITYREDMRVLERYRAEDFAGVARPLLPNPITGNSFRIAVLFRTELTLEQVNLAIRELQAEELARAHPPLASLDPESVSPEELETVWRAGTQAADESHLDLSEEDTHVNLSGRPHPSKVPEDDEAEKTRSRFDYARFEQPPARAVGAIQHVGPYTIVEELGSGGAGRVYVAQKHGTGPMLALKVLHQGLAEIEDELRFDREARVCEQLDSPHTLSLIDRGVTDDGLSFIALPLVTGETLRELIDQGLPVERSLRYVDQLLEGAAELHAQNVVHRDLKPSNIVVQAGKDQIRIVDYGLARFIQANDTTEFATIAGAISGSPAYVAPETISGDPNTAATDVYSLGVLCFELLSGKRPLLAPTAYAFLKEHLIGTPLTLRQAMPTANWHPDLERVLARMLAKSPRDRPSCREVLATLRGGLRDRVLEQLAIPPEASERTPANLLNPYYGGSEQ